jgi:hypothetical protein
MADFEKGDRVRGNTHRDPGWGDVLEGTVVTVGSLTTALKLSDGSSGFVYTESLEPAPAEWEKELLGADDGPKVGDRVRFVHEGVVTYLGEAWVEIDNSARVLGKGERVEVLERKPTLRVGTLIRDDDDGLYLIDGGPEPVFAEGSDPFRSITYPTVASIESAVRAGTAKIIHEPPSS